MYAKRLFDKDLFPTNLLTRNNSRLTLSGPTRPFSRQVFLSVCSEECQQTIRENNAPTYEVVATHKLFVVAFVSFRQQYIA